MINESMFLTRNGFTMEYLDADEAAEFLGVKRSTLYAYVSRGLLESVDSADDGRRRRYRRSDLARLKRKSDASSGHAAAASAALNWGAPSLETRIGAITPLGPRYRGTRLRELVDRDLGFENVAEYLWTGDLPEGQTWRMNEVASDRQCSSSHTSLHPVDLLVTAVQSARLADPKRFAGGRGETLNCARRLIKESILQCGVMLRDESLEDKSEEWSIARCLGWALNTHLDEPTIHLLDTALIVVADHGINASTFAGRVAASTGADLYACIIAALSAFSGPRHGLMSERANTLIDEAASRERPGDLVQDYLRRGESLPGFGHPLYEHGDPRFSILRQAVDNCIGDPPDLDILDAVCEAADCAGLAAPNLDFGLTAVVRALNLPPSAGPMIFAAGRMAGWVAHALEQREQGFLLRPTADYVQS